MNKLFSVLDLLGIAAMQDGGAFLRISREQANHLAHELKRLYDIEEAARNLSTQYVENDSEPVPLPNHHLVIALKKALGK